MKYSLKDLSENASYKIVALLITLILWVIILGSKEATLVKMIRAEYLLPRDMVITNSVPKEVAFRISGPRLTLKRFSDTAEPLGIDLSSALEGTTTIRIHPDSIDVPPGLRVSSVSPATIAPKLERVMTKTVPIEVQLTGKLSGDNHIVRVTVTPLTIEVTGVRSRVEDLKKVLTEPVDISSVQSSLTKEVALVVDDLGVPQKTPPHAKLELVIR